MSVPAEFGPYRVVRPLGRGGMGAVYLALDTRLDRQVALKVFTGGNARGELARQELLHEARAAASLNHQHIASVHDVLDIDGQVAIVFEYVEGDTLAQRLLRGPLDADETVRLTSQLVDALAAAHQRGIVHRDLKPANIAITSAGMVKVLDFGVARSMPAGADDAGAAQTTVAWFVGTIGYAAPEQCLGQSVDVRADIFSLGVVIFEMLTGRRPFKGLDASVVLRSMLSDVPARVSSLVDGVPQELDELIARMLSSDPARRPQAVADVGEVLRGLAPTTRMQLTVDHPRRRRWVLAAVIVTAIVTGALVSPLLLDRGSPTTDNPAARSPVVAVLPLTNASGDASKDYLATGVAENLITQLAAIPSITVLSRAAVSDAQRRKNGLSALARELDATYLIDGSVQQSGDRLRIDLRLVEPDGSIAWADNVEGHFNQVFELQKRLTSALAQALSVRLSAADRATLARQPTASTEALDAYWRGRSLLERRDVKGNTDAALVAFDQAIALDPRFADAHAARGEAFWAKYNETNDPQYVQPAIAAGTDALRFGPDRAQVRYSLALTLEGSGRLDEAVEELQHALALQPQNDDARNRLGLILARQGRIDEALAEFDKAIALRPRFWGHYSAMGLSLAQAGRYAPAADAFKRVIELQPDSAFGYQQLGFVYHTLGDMERAVENYRKAIAITPMAQAYSNLGAILHQRADYPGAVEAYQHAIDLRPSSHITHRNLGDALQRLGRTREAHQAFDRAAAIVEQELQINPHDAQRHAFLAVYAAKLGEHDRAIRAMDEALRLAPADIQVLFRAGVVHALAGRHDAAIDALGRAVRGGFSRTRIRDDEDLTRLSHLAAFRSLVAPPSPGGIG